MAAPDKILELVDRFEQHLDTYKRGIYNETQLRREFIDPFFEVLNWDVANKKGYAEAYKEVVHEDAIKVGGATKAPDYCFRIGGIRKFFLETKKPSVNIKEDVHPAYQLRRYAWSAKLPLSILTDFEEFAVYDCRIKPVKTDKPSSSRILLLHYTDYPSRWQEIQDIFSQEAILKGSFDRYAESKKIKKGTAEVDSAFLQEIERWRDLLARNLALRNPNLTQRELNFATQLTIDRIIFLRICEDRGIESYGRLMALRNGENIYQRLFELFRQADDRYNSGLFHFQSEKDCNDAPDQLTPHLTLDDAVLKDIFKNLYYPESPYEFSVLPADILGQVYEQFLGKVIRLTTGHRAEVEDKPEVRKAGGVYYTPTYIVDYIVKQTVGKLLEDKTPGPRGTASKLKILDPACGSGSFLLGAYQYLLDWYLQQYLKGDPETWAKGRTPCLYKTDKAEWKLTTNERKRILLNNIYGVDIDSQAVEVTKLSLLLKVLEGGRQMALFHEKRALPNLSNNIKCGNSLIGSDFYKGQQTTMFDQEEMFRINAFDWDKEFTAIMKDGSFDAVIGNPPYGAWFEKDEELYFKQSYKLFDGIKDVYVNFIEKGLSLLSQNGRISFIIPSAWTGGPHYKSLRNFLLGKKILNLILLPYDVFSNAYIDTAIFVISNAPPPPNHCVWGYVYKKRHKLNSIDLKENELRKIRQQEWQTIQDQKFILDPASAQLIKRLQNSTPFIFDDAILMRRGVLFNPSLLTETQESNIHYPYFEGDVYRYTINAVADRWVEFGNKMKERPKEFFWFEGDRILLRRLVNRQQRIMAVNTSDTFITNKNLYTLKVRDDFDIKTILGVLNSKLISFLYLQQVSQATKDDFPQVTVKDILSLPFPSLSDASNKARLIELVDRMLSLNKKLVDVKTPNEKTLLTRQIETTDQQIDRLVYDLYGLTEEEIKIVEEETRKG